MLLSFTRQLARRMLTMDRNGGAIEPLTIKTRSLDNYKRLMAGKLHSPANRTAWRPGSMKIRDYEGMACEVVLERPQKHGARRVSWAMLLRHGCRV